MIEWLLSLFPLFLAYRVALFKAGAEVAMCSCKPHARNAQAAIEEALGVEFKRAYPD